MGVEKDQDHAAGFVVAAHLVGQAPVARRKMGIDRHGQGDDYAFGRISQRGGKAPVDDSRGQVPAQAGDGLARNFFDELAQARPDARERCRRGKERIKDFRAQA